MNSLVERTTFSFAPHSRQVIASAFTDDRTDTAGTSSFASTTGAAPSTASVAWTERIRPGRSPPATVLLLTCAVTMSATCVSRLSSVMVKSACKRMEALI